MTVTVSEAFASAVSGEIRAWIGRRGLNQSQVAVMLGENDIWVSRRLRNKVATTMEDLVRFAEVLECGVDQLMPPLDVIRASVDAELLAQIDPQLLDTSRYPELLAAA